MNPTLFALLAAAGVALCALLIVASGLIHTSLKRRRAVAAGGPDIPSRILDDLRPVEDLLVDFVRHSPELADVLAILSPLRSPVSFARLRHETRIGRSGSPQSLIATDLLISSLFTLGLARLIRMTSGGLVITEVGREVANRVVGHARTVLGEPEEEPSHLDLADAPHREITMTAADRAELAVIVKSAGQGSNRGRAEFAALEKELKRANIVSSQEIPPDVITLNSQAELLDLEAKGRMRLTPVLPPDAEIEAGKISVLAQLGSAMLGYRVGDEFQWQVPNGVDSLYIGPSPNPSADSNEVAERVVLDFDANGCLVGIGFDSDNASHETRLVRTHHPHIPRREVWWRGVCRKRVPSSSSALPAISRNGS